MMMYLYFICLFFCGAGEWTQSLKHVLGKSSTTEPQPRALFVYFYVVLRIEPSASHMQGKHSTIELQP